MRKHEIIVRTWLLSLATGKRLLGQTVKTKMKYRKRRHFIRVSAVC